jgi:hypothetical protein
MYNFTVSTWTIEATDRRRERVAKISDAGLLREMEACASICAPDNAGSQPRGALRHPARNCPAGDLQARAALEFCTTLQQ